MRVAMARGAIALATLLVLAGASFAGTMVTIQVVDQGVPVEGAAVSMLASNGQINGATNQSGEVSADLSAKYYRLKINGVSVDGVFQASTSTVVVDIHH